MALTAEKKRKLLMNIYDSQISRQEKKIKSGTYNVQQAQRDIPKMNRALDKYNRIK